MSDKWINDAFRESVDNIPFDDPDEEAEFQAYQRAIVEHKMDVIRHCGEIVGIARMNALSKVVMDSGNTKTFTGFIHAISVLCFSLGYKEGKK